MIFLTLKKMCDHPKFFLIPIQLNFGQSLATNLVID